MVSGYFYQDDDLHPGSDLPGLIIDFISKPFLQEEILEVLQN